MSRFTLTATDAAATRRTAHHPGCRFADPPVGASRLAATAANDEAWTATFGLSLEMLLRGRFTVEIQRGPLRAGRVLSPGVPAIRGACRKGSLQIRWARVDLPGACLLDPEPVLG